EAATYHDKAVTTLQPVADVAKGDPHLANILGATYRAAHDASNAEQWFRAALTADPAFVDARVNLAALLESEGKMPEAIAEYQKSFTQAPKREDVAMGLALALERSRDIAGAEKIYQGLLSTDGGNVPTLRAHAFAGRFWARRGNIEGARKE